MPGYMRGALTGLRTAAMQMLASGRRAAMHAIVHIGAPKAGSSAIQYAIGLNAEQIAAQGIYPYRPSVGPGDRALSTRFRPGQKNLPPDVRLKLKDAQNAQEWSQRCWDELAETLRRDRPELTLISSEDLFGLPSPGEFIAALRELFDEITLIAYVRDPVAQFLSQANQQIRGGVRFRDLKTPLDYRYYAWTNLEGYLDAVGRGRIVVRNIDSANLRDGDVVTDFFEQVSAIAGRGIAPERMPPRANESLCAAATVWLMSVNETFERFGKGDEPILRLRHDLIARLRRAPELAGLPMLKLTDPELAGLIRHNAREMTGWLNDTFLEGQIPLDTGTPPARMPEAAEMRARMREWMLGHLTPEALDAVLRVAMPLTQEDAAAGVKRKAKRG